MITKKLFVAGIFLVVTGFSFSQSILQPNYALKSHETLQIRKIEITSYRTVIFLSVENQTTGGYFCADKNIFIINPDGTRSKLISSSGIPVCPETYKFKAIGEKLNFVLTFSPLKTGTGWIDLTEDCNDNCFSFYGVVLDTLLNKKIDAAFVLAENKEPVLALDGFIDILNKVGNKNQGVEGLLYINIIKLAKETGNLSKASEWYFRLKSSGTPGVSRYVKYLNDQGIIF